MKNVVITGTSRGIGFEMVKLFSEAGHKVLALSRNSKPVLDLKLPNVSAFDFDITEESHLNNLQRFLRENLTHVDILINNSGALVNIPFAEISLEEFKRCYEVNVFGVAQLIK